ncbi:MAG: diaminopimelate epimerase [Candidatus Diapherotrites archaeon]
MRIAFSKIHGIGNDFIVIDEQAKELVPEKNKAAFAKKFCNRRFSIGADGVLFMVSSKKADFRMRLFNADGSEAENCVNGLRCVALEKFLLEGKKKKDFLIETIAGLVNAKVVSFQGRENKAEVEIQVLGKAEAGAKAVISVEGKSFEFWPVDVGNPHAVIFLKEKVEGFPVERFGHAMEFSEKFAPKRVNAEFVNVLSPSNVKMRVHERGACETQACGSGSIAIVLAGISEGVLEKGKWVSVEQPGGTLQIKVDKGVLLKGSAEKVFEGSLEA